MNKLDKIIQSQEFDKEEPTLSINDCRQIALKFAKYILEKAAEKAEVGDYSNGAGCDMRVIPETITDTLNEYL